MSNVSGKLDLSGINVNKIVATRKPRAGIRPPQTGKFSITAADDFDDGEEGCSSTKKCFVLLLAILITATIFSLMTSSTPTVESISSAPMKKLTPGLRKIIRMTCVHDSNTHCTSPEVEGGEYVVNIKDCAVFDFNGIPFTDVYRDSSDNFHVPPSPSMTLEMSKACPPSSATFDTNVKYHETYAEKNTKTGPITKIVWIPTKDCYRDFSLSISKQEILKNTPTSMIQKKELNGVVAYIYNVEGSSVSGTIRVTGTGCEVPVRIYSKRS